MPQGFFVESESDDSNLTQLRLYSKIDLVILFLINQGRPKKIFIKLFFWYAGYNIQVFILEYSTKYKFCSYLSYFCNTFLHILR